MTLPYRLRTGLVRVGGLVLFALSLPWNLSAAWPALLLLRLFGLVRDLGWEPGGVLVGTFTERATGQLDIHGRPRRWRFSTTFGHSVAYQPRHRAKAWNARTRIQDHEHVHVRQCEDESMRAFLTAAIVVAATGSWAIGLAIWATSYARLATNFLTAFLRGNDVYRGCSHEEHAYFSCNEIRAEHVGKSWSEIANEGR